MEQAIGLCFSNPFPSSDFSGNPTEKNVELMPRFVTWHFISVDTLYAGKISTKKIVLAHISIRVVALYL